MVWQASMSKRYGMETGITRNNNRNKMEITTLNHTTMLNADLNTKQQQDNTTKQCRAYTGMGNLNI